MSGTATGLVLINGACLAVSIVAGLPGFALVFFFLLAICLGKGLAGQ